jgi:TPR repeat protein
MNDENPTSAKEQYELGSNYKDGTNGLPQDYNKAFYWYTKAAEQGHGEAMFWLAWCYRDGHGVSKKDPKMAQTWEAESVERLTEEIENGNNADALCRLGFIYHLAPYGGVSKNEDKAASYYAKAMMLLERDAEKGNAVAQYKLSMLLLTSLPGRGGASYYMEGNPNRLRNNEKAVSLLKKAAAQGNADAQCELAGCYRYGIGVPLKNEEKAIYWYTKAAEQGNKKAKETLAETSKKGGCFVATCVYGSYDCPQVWTLRRYRDSRLSMSWLGRRFIRVYYAVSPKIVGLFGDKKWFNGLCKPIIDSIVRKLQNSGVGDSPYSDV